MNDLFDQSAEYESMLRQGLKYSGETMYYFLDGRLQRLCDTLGQESLPTRILDFGCGIGAGSRALASLFPDAQIVGVDTAEMALSHARQLSDSNRLRFLTVDELSRNPEECDLCYVNGVFHHIPPDARQEALGLIGRCLCPGGHFFFFENNPWNPGTQWVMSQIPFDKDAHTITIPAAQHLLSQAGFSLRRTETLFFFPRVLANLRRFENFLGRRTWLGAQYMIWSTYP